MSLRAPLFYVIREQTARVAQAAFPKGNSYIRMGHALEPIYSNYEYDPEARSRCKRSTEWVGYTFRLTNICDKDLPYLITDVTTTPATSADTS